MKRNFYEVLQVSPDADKEVISAAYRALSKRYHPDVNKTADSTSVMKEINRAYKILNDPVERAKYDRTLSTQQDTTSSAQTAFHQEERGQSRDSHFIFKWLAQAFSKDVHSFVDRYRAYPDDGTVLDTLKNLMWAAKDNGADINWQDAKSYCENYRGGGYSDWRMPTQDELEELSNKYMVLCSNSHIITMITLTDLCVWASEMRGFDAAYYRFGFGMPYWCPQSYSGHARALPVRSGK